MAYDKVQQVYVLSMLSNLAALKRGTVEELETELLAEIEKSLQLLEPQMGVWTVVWGPVVYQAPRSNVADNVLFAARKEGEGEEPPQVVVATSGTNPISAFGWLVEDFAVNTQVPWPYGGLATGAKISLGTFVGFSILQSMKAASGFPGAGSGIREFLAGQTSSAVDVTVTGHSLGGALSPTLTLWLSDTCRQWDPSGHATLGCMPTAGATPGNAAFAGYYDQELGSTTLRIFNRLDIVPHAWNTQDLEQIPGIYEPEIPASDFVRAFIAFAIRISKGGDYTQLVVETARELPGQVDTSIIDPEKSDTENFFAQAGFQHVIAYLQMLGIELPTPMESTLVEAFAADPETSPVSGLEVRLRRERGG